MSRRKEIFLKEGGESLFRTFDGAEHLYREKDGRTPLRSFRRTNEES